MGVVVAPIIGPTLGGWITDSYPGAGSSTSTAPGVLALFMVNLFVEDPPTFEPISSGASTMPASWPWRCGSFAPTGPRQGQEDDWFAATWICATTALRWLPWRPSSAGTDGCGSHRRPARLKNRNFAAGTLISAVMP